MNYRVYTNEKVLRSQLFVGVVKVGGVNADEEKSLGSEYGVQGFPTIKIFTGKKVEDYNGGRTAKDIVDAALRAVRNKVEAQLGGKTSGGGSSGGSAFILLC